jgi:hypothetical protein
MGSFSAENYGVVSLKLNKSASSKFLTHVFAFGMLSTWADIQAIFNFTYLGLLKIRIVKSHQ